MIEATELIECNRVKKFNPPKHWTNVPVRTENLYSARKMNMYYSRRKKVSSSSNSSSSSNGGGGGSGSGSGSGSGNGSGIGSGSSSSSSRGG